MDLDKIRDNYFRECINRTIDVVEGEEPFGP